MDERELISAMTACIGTPAIAAEPCARVAARYADEREAEAVAAGVDAERAKTLIVAEQVLGPVAAGHLAEALAEIGARVAASTTPTDPEPKNPYAKNGKRPSGSQARALYDAWARWHEDPVAPTDAEADT